MRVLLVEPPFSSDQVHVKSFGLAEPLSLEILGGCLRDHEVRLLDMRLDADLRGTMEAFRPQVVGAGCYATGLYLTKRLFREVKAIDPGVFTVAGGHHASLIPQDFADESIDAVCVGEGEVTLRELVEARERGLDLAGVPGLALRRNGAGQLAFTGPRPLVDLDAMPLPDRDLVRAHRRRYFRGAWRPIQSMTTERGCPYRCRFCSMWKVNDGRHRVRSPESVVAEIAGLEAPYVDFIDDNTLHDVPRALRIAELLRRSGIRKAYKAYARSDTIARHPEVVEKWAEVGMKLVLVGLESHSDADLQRYGKRNTIANNEEAIRILHANGVEIASYFVIHPEYAAEDFDALERYVERWGLSHPVYTVLTPLPGTDYYEQVQDRLLTRNYEYFDFFHSVLPTRLPAREFHRRFYRLWRRSYSFKNFLRALGKGKVAFSPAQVLGFREFMHDLKMLAERTEFAPVPGSSS